MSGELGREYDDDEVIVRENEISNCMYIIQEGRVEIVTTRDGREYQLAIRGKGEFIGEMSIFLDQRRTADVRALGKARLLRIDKNNFLKRIHQDPTIAFKLVETLSRRVHELSTKLADEQK